MQDTELLRQYFHGGSQEAFAELVRRHIDLVFSPARRQVLDASLAEDVSQIVFCLLARKAGSLLRFTTLTGWLYRTTCFSAAKVLRGELRRHRREQQAMLMNSDAANANDGWEQLAPMLDEAIATLGDKDRLAVLLRFFQRRPMRVVGDSLGVSEAAAKMRIARSIERLRAHFAKRGVACSVAGLSALLADRAVEAAPASLSVKVTSTALSGVSSSAGWSLAQLAALLARFKAATLVLGASSAVLVFVAGWHVVNPDRDSMPLPVVAASVTRSPETPPADRITPSATGVLKIAYDDDLTDAIARLRAALHSTNDTVAPGFEAPEALRAFGTHLQVAFEVLKEEAGAHDKSRHSADDAELAPCRAVGTMGFLGKSVPEAIPWLWTLYDKESSTASDSMAYTALCSLNHIGFEPQNVARLAESVLEMTTAASSEVDTNALPDEAAINTAGQDAFVKSQVAGWIAEVIKRDPEATKPFILTVRNLLTAQDASVRFWAACALLQSDGGQTPEVLDEVVAGLKNPDQERLAWASQLLKDFGDAARPIAPLLVEAASASEGSAREWAYLAAGKIAGELRSQVPEVGEVLAKEDEDQRLLDRVNSGTYTGNDLVAMLADRGSAALGATLLGEMGRAATNALSALFEVASRQKQDDKDKILTAIRKIDPHAALSCEDAASIITSLLDDSDGPRDESQSTDRLVKDSNLLEMSWCTRVGFLRFVTNVAATNPDGYKAFVGAVLAKEPGWRDLLVTNSRR